MESSLSASATLLALVLGLSPYKTIQEIRAQGDTSGFSFAPFLAIFVNAALACIYGFVVSNNVLIFVNGLNGIFSIYFIGQFYIYSKQKPMIRTLIMTITVGILVVIYHTSSAKENPAIRIQMGLLSNVATVIMFGSPLATMATVIKTRNAASIPVALSVASFACSTNWFLYGIVIWDYFVMIPNILGMILSGIQLALIGIYGRKGISIKEADGSTVHTTV